MPNTTKDNDQWRPDPSLASIMNKSWVELAEEEDAEFIEEAEPQVKNGVKTPDKEYAGELPLIPEATLALKQEPDNELALKQEPENELALKQAPENEDIKGKAFKRIDFGGSPTREESPMKVEDEDIKAKVFKRIDFGGTPTKEESPMKVEVESPLRNADEESPMKEGTPVKAEESPSSKMSEATRRLWASPRRRNPIATSLGPAVSPRRPTVSPRSLSEVMSPPRDKLKRKREIFSSPASSKGSPGSERFSSPKPKRKPSDLETDAEVLRRRQKQIDYGKNTEGYRHYLEAIPKHKRSHRHPHTPPRELKHSRRAWDGMVRAWRQHLHNWDPPGADSLDSLDCLDMLDSMSDTSGSAPSDAVSEISYPGSGGKLRPPQRPASTLSLEEFPPLP